MTSGLLTIVGLLLIATACHCAWQSKVAPTNFATSTGFCTSVACGSSLVVVSSTGFGAVGGAYLFDGFTGQGNTISSGSINGLPGDLLGTAIAISLNSGVLLLGTGNGSRAGRVEVFTLHVNFVTASYIYDLQSPTSALGDMFGSAMASSDECVMFGAPGANSGVGLVYYTCQTMSTSVPALTPLNPTLTSLVTTNSRYGSAVALNSQYAVVGAPGCQPAGASAATGCVFVFKRETRTQWAYVQVLSLTTTNMFGSSVAIGDRCTGVVSNSSVPHIYCLSADTFQPDTSINDIIGTSTGIISQIAMADSCQIVGARGASTTYAHVFCRNATGWTNMDVSNTWNSLAQSRLAVSAGNAALCSQSASVILHTPGMLC